MNATAIIGWTVLTLAWILIVVCVADHLIQVRHRNHHQIRRRIKAYTAR